MADDDRQAPRDDAGDDQSGGRPEPGPASRPDPEPDPEAGSRPEAGSPPDPGVDGTVADDRTVPVSRPVSPEPTRAPAWAGRAGVPSAQPAAQGTGDWGADYDPGRRWWMPILVGTVALLLVGVLIFGVWLILQSGDDEPGPVVPVPSTSAPSPSARPTSAAPTTTQPTPSATTASTVQMPPLVGRSRAAATDILDELGVSYRIRSRSSQEPTGTVLETDPPAGEEISPDDEVIVVVSRRTSPDPEPTGPTPTAEADANG